MTSKPAASSPVEPATGSQPLPEPRLRGTLTDLSGEQRAVLHALVLAREDVERWCDALSEAELQARPHGLPPVYFQLRHIVGSLDRLLTYAEGDSLSVEQKQQLAAEMEPSGSKPEILAEFQRGLAAAEARIRRQCLSLKSGPGPLLSSRGCCTRRRASNRKAGIVQGDHVAVELLLLPIICRDLNPTSNTVKGRL